MQTFSDKPSTDGGSAPPPGPVHATHTPAPHDTYLPVLAGAAISAGAVGAVFVLADLESPLRAPLTLFFLLAAPAAAVATALRGLEPWGRAVASLAAAGAVNLLVAQTMLALHVWSVRGGVLAVAAVSLGVALAASVRRPQAAHPARTSTGEV